MMRDDIQRGVAAPLQLRDGVVQEEIDQDGVRRRVGIQLEDLTSQELDGVYATTANLDLPC